MSETHSYKKDLHALRIELSKLSYHLMQKKSKVCVLFEGRDTAGKDGTIKRILKYMPSRQTRMIALDKPSEREQKSWYFQRYVPHLPIQGEIVFFNRSWYNRAGVEPVMSFCTKKEYKAFMEQVPDFEAQLVKDGFILIKYWLDIDKAEQKKRLEDRAKSILKKWKLSKIDAKAQNFWDSYTHYRDQMLEQTDHEQAGWTIINFQNKKLARLALIRDFLQRFSYPDRNKETLKQKEPSLVYPFSDELYKQHLLFS